MRARARRRLALAGLALLGLVPQIALEQGYSGLFKYNPYVIPTITLLAALIFLYLLLTARPVVASGVRLKYGWGARRPMTFTLLVLGLGGTLGIAVAAGWLLFLQTSKERVLQLRQEETARRAAIGVTSDSAADNAPKALPPMPAQTAPPEPRTDEPPPPADGAPSVGPQDAPLTPLDISDRVKEAPFLLRPEVRESFLGLQLTCTISLYSIEEASVPYQRFASEVCRAWTSRVL